MIIFGILMLGSALAIPATRAMQEAQMRDRIASFSQDDGDDPATESTSGANLPAYVEIDDSDANADSGSAQGATNGRGSDVASTIAELNLGGERVETAEAVPVDMPRPTYLRIPDVEIDTEIIEVGSQIIDIDGQKVREWEVAAYAAGHHNTSANPGEGGNIVITGHNDWEGEVFRTLEHVEIGTEVYITTEDGEHKYVVEEIHMRREVGVSLEERLATGQFMADMPEERVTIITCWPYGINDHRVIVVARPVQS